MTEENDSVPTGVLMTSVKIPPFWPADPELWFSTVGATKGTKQQLTKFQHVVASLSPDVAAEVRDLLIKPPAKDPYDELRRELTTRTGLSPSKRLQQLLRTLSQLLRRIKKLLGDNAPLMDDKLLTQLFFTKAAAESTHGLGVLI